MCFYETLEGVRRKNKRELRKEKLKKITSWIKKKWIELKIEALVELYEWQVGGNCGLCGAWIGDELFRRDKVFRVWGMCKRCR